MSAPNATPPVSPPPAGESAEATPRIPATVKGLAVVSLLNDFASEMVYPLLPAFLVGTLGGSPTLLGALDGGADLASAITKRLSGGLADRPGWRKPLIAVGYFSAILIRPLMSVAAAAWQVVGFRVLDRIGKGLRTPARDALIADVTPAPIRGRAYGFHNAADHFGSILGALLAWWLLTHTVEVRSVLAFSVIPGVAAGLFVLFVLRQAPRPPGAPSSVATETATRDILPAPESAPKQAPVRDATGRTFWLPVTALALLVLLRLPEALLLLRLQDLGVGVSSIPLVWAGLHVVRTAVSYPGGWLADRVGPRATVAAGSACFAAGAGALGLGLSAAGAIAVFLALGLCAGLSESSERLLVTQLAPKRTGRGFGAYHALTGLAALPAATGFGFLYKHLGGPSALGLSALGMGAGTVVWLAVMPRTGRGADAAAAP